MTTSTVAPSYPRDYEFHHLAVRFPFMGLEAGNPRFPLNTQNLTYYRNILETDQFWMMRRLGRSAWLCKGMSPLADGHATNLLVSKRAAVRDPEQGDDNNGTPILDDGDVPGFLRFSTLDDAGLRFWSRGQYLSWTFSYFPTLKGFSYHKVEFDPHRKEKVKSPHLVFSGIYKYYNGGTLEQLMGRRDELFRRYSWYNPDEHWWTSYRLPECLIWHIIGEIGQALIKLHSGDPRRDEEDQINGVQREHAWWPIIHGRIIPRNVWFHFDEPALESEDEDTRLRANCFPQVILGDFCLADFEDPGGPDTPDLVGQNHYQQYKVAPKNADDSEFVIKRRWWDIWFFGLLVRKMLLFGDCGIINRTEVPVPPGFSRAGGADTRKKFPDYLEEESLGMVKLNTARYWTESRPNPKELDPSRTWQGNPGFREWNSELREIAWLFEEAMMGNQENDGIMLPGRHFVDDDIRTNLPDLGTIRTIVEKARERVAEFKVMPMWQLVEQTNDECLLVTEDFGPRHEVDDTMLYRPKHAVTSRHQEMVNWNSQDAVNSDMRPFFGPWSYLYVSYNPDHVRLNNQLPAPALPEDLSHEVLSFGFLPYMGEQNPDPSKNNSDPYGDPLGKTVAEKHRREYKERSLREAARRAREEQAKVMGKSGLEAPHMTMDERRKAAWDLYKGEEDEAQLRRKQTAFETRSDILLEALNAVVIQGVGSELENENRGFWERWREGSADSFELTNTP